LSKAPERLALIQNQDLINMIRLGKASIPLDLMNFTPEDAQPSIFLLKEDDRQSILTVFNWTDQERDHLIDLATAGLPATDQYAVTDVLDNQKVAAAASGVLAFHQPAHSVRVLKIVDAQVPAVAPALKVEHPSAGNAGSTLTFAAHSRGGDAVLSYHWDFGDGVTMEGSDVKHTYTEPGEFNVRVTAAGLSGLSAEDHLELRISGSMPTTFDPQRIKRYEREK
jgi:hypothetical protein